MTLSGVSVMKIVGLVVSVVSLVEHVADHREHAKPKGCHRPDDTPRLTLSEVGVTSIVHDGGVRGNNGGFMGSGV